MSSILAAPFVPTWSSYDHFPVPLHLCRRSFHSSSVMKTETRHRIGSALRWIVFLPAAGLAGIVAYAFFQLGIGIMGAREIPILDELTANGLGGFAFVLAGSLTAPAGRKIVSLVLVILFAGLSGWAAVGYAIVDDGFGIVGLVAGIIGAGIGFFFAADMDERSQRSV